jgi:hypothetical protein
MKKFFVSATFLLSLIATAPACFAQVNASLSGTVSDSSGALIPGVEVTAKNNNTGIADTRVTNETGNFVFPSLQPGTYTLSSALAGFQAATYNNVELGQGQSVRLNFTLQVGGAAQNVEVIAADTILATTAASVGNVLADKDVASLPLASRNVLDMLETTAGVVYANGGFGQSPSFGGLAIGGVNTTRDGLVTNDGRYNSSNGAYSAIFTSPDMIEEVRVTTNNIDPALGRGAAQVQMRTRSGTNDFHGAAFYTNNNSFLNSQTYFQNLQHAAKNYANRNQFGGRVGGPIIKNKMFFFFLTDDQRYLDKTTVNTQVLTPLARQGIFRYMNNGQRNGAANSTTPSVDTLGNPLNPANVSSFNVFSDIKDPNRTGIDPTFEAKYYLPNLPMPNNYQVGDGLNTAGFQWLRPENGLDGATGQSPDTNRNHLTLRYDYQINTKNKVSFIMTREKNWGVTGQTGEPDVPAGGFGDIYRTPYSYNIQYTATISPTILNEFRFARKQDTWLGTSPLDKGCCLFGASESSRTGAAQTLYNAYPSAGPSFLYIANPQIESTAMAYINNFGVASPRTTYSPFTQWADTLSFTKGAHSLSAGFEFDFASSTGANTGNTQTTRPNAALGINPSFPIPDFTTSSPYAKGLNASDLASAQNLLAILAGSINQITETFYINSPTQTGWTDYTKTIFFTRSQHENDWDLFFKDNWKASKNLTLVLGVRYDKYGVVYDSLGLAGNYFSSFGAGEAGIFGCSGGSFNVMWQPGAGNCGSASPSLTNAQFVGKDSPQPNKLVHGNDWNNIAPSFGFSYSVPRLRNTVLRGGYGINYSAAPDFLGYSGSIGSFPGNSLLNTQTTFPTGYFDISRVAANQSLFPLPTAGSAPFTPVPLNGVGSRTGSISAYADNYRTPDIQSFNFSIQREITRDLTLDVGWVGNKTSKLYFGHQINDTNVFENGILTAFNAVRAGGESPLMTQIFNGVNVPGPGVVNGTTLTAGQALRKSTTTNTFFANGDVGGFANFLNTNATVIPGGQPGGLLLHAGLPQNFIVVSPQFGSVSLSDNGSNSTYHSLQAHVSKRFSHGATGQFSYTFAKVLGDNGSIRDPRNFHLSKTLGSFNRTHVIASNFTYDLPFGANRAFFANAPGWAQQVVGGWQLASIASWNAGGPLSFTVTNRGTYSRATETADQVGPLQKGNVVKGNGFVQYFADFTTQAAPKPNFGGDTSLPGVFTNQIVVNGSGQTVLQNPAPGSIGNTSLNQSTISGPGALGFNASITKTVRMSEGKTFSLRADAVNVLNKPQWGNPSTDINSTTFGRITTATGNRQVTLNARIDF